ncbi:MAG: TetR/AcrR family transcriptional regulator [Xanthomonadales bacterium]|nr:TetR/AcrR family transcriptional regulator [Xanthomonadales bacterium]
MSSVSTQHRSRGRPRSEKKRENILAAATRLFTDRGYDGVSVDDIAQAAAVSKQTVYTHFDSKENLFGLAVAEKCRSSGMDAEAIDKNEPPETVIPALARRFVDLVTSPEALRVYAICTNSADSHPRLAELFYRHGPMATVAVLEGYLAAQHRLGRLQVPEPHAAAWQLLCMLKGEAHLRRQFGLEPLSPAAEQAYIDRCVDVFLRAYGPVARG